ncbi:LAFE_0H11232g1_1 [Lachancea fermentati]|uniref:LAFE_0H11232g1_1 n=1 Tax=Lachancea fermentati TaxID=4955 RepID=A0A1G4MKE0_LACFM|nr:LAFE_0H11232g1_1 [Lachancea fermentati]
MKREREEVVSLPIDYQSKHTEDFNSACKTILEIDPSLLDTIVSGDFPLFLKKEQELMTLNHHFTKLASSILSQQISGSAAMSIKKKVTELFAGSFPTYQDISKLIANGDTAKLRSCGLSGRKVLYLESLATYFNDNEDAIAVLLKQDDDEIIEALVKNVKGIGPWSAKMFLVTSLERMNVFAPEDLGVARGCSRYLDSRPDVLKELLNKRVAIKRSKIKHKKSNWKIYDEDIVDKCGQLFAPYRTVFMFILWRLSSTDVDAMAKNSTS